MEQEIKKLVDLYEDKIRYHESILKIYGCNLKKYRKEGNKQQVEYLLKDRISLFAQLNACIQAKSDIENLLDFI